MTLRLIQRAASRLPSTAAAPAHEDAAEQQQDGEAEHSRAFGRREMVEDEREHKSLSAGCAIGLSS
jgi:hypothetical protein